jgi:hypothetical protein
MSSGHNVAISHRHFGHGNLRLLRVERPPSRTFHPVSADMIPCCAQSTGVTTIGGGSAMRGETRVSFRRFRFVAFVSSLVRDGHRGDYPPPHAVQSDSPRDASVLVTFGYTENRELPNVDRQRSDRS